MTRADGSEDRRTRGSIRVRGNSFQVRVFAGKDPVTGKDVYLTESVKGTNKAACKAADKAQTRLLAARATSNARSVPRVMTTGVRRGEICQLVLCR